MRRFLFINENIAGHRTVRANMATVFASIQGVDVDFLDVPTASGLRRLGSARVPPLNRWDADLQPLRAQLLAADWVRRRLQLIGHQYDALHFYTHNTALLSTSIMDRVPSVVSSDSTNILNSTRIHGRRPSRFTPIAASLAARFETPVYRHARAITPSSAWARESLLHDYKVDHDRIVVAPMGILVPDITEPAPRSGRLRIAFIGNPFQRKGGQWLLDLHERRWKDRADLVLVTTSEIPSRPGVHIVSDLTGGDSRLWDVLLSCDVFAFPSSIDQAPNAVLEAMAAWLPVVALDVAAIPDMVIDGYNGIICPPQDADAFGSAVDRLLTDEELRRWMGRNSRQRACATFNMATCMKHLLSILDDVCWTGGE